MILSARAKVDSTEGSSKYCIQYTPTVRGWHELSLTVNGEEVASSPFPVFVSIHPTKLGKPVRITCRTSKPHDITVTPSGNIVVVEQNNIVTLGKNEESSLDCGNLCNPWGITVDDTDDCIYITDNSKVVKLNADFKLIEESKPIKGGSSKGSSFGFFGRDESGYRGITVLGDEVFVCHRR